MTDFYKELNLNKETSSQQLCEELNAKKQQIIESQSSTDGLLSESGKKMVDLIDDAVEIFSDPFKLAEYNAKLLESDIVESTSAPEESSKISSGDSSHASDIPDYSIDIPQESHTMSPEEQDAWNQKDTDLSSELFLLNRYSNTGDGDVSQLDFEQTRFIYQRCVLRSAQYGAAWADYAASHGNPFIQQIISSRNESLSTPSLKDIKEKIASSDIPKVDLPKIDKTAVDSAKRQVGNLKKKPLIIGIAAIVIILIAAIAIIPSITNKSDDGETVVEEVAEKDPYAGKAVALSTLTPSNNEDIYYYTTEIDDQNYNNEDNVFLDTIGNVYSNAVVLESGSYYDNPTTITYTLDDNYPRFTANISSQDNTSGSYYLWIYTDGKEDEPIYEATLDRLSVPTNIDLDINGASSLSVAVLRDDSSDTCNVILSTGYLYIDPSIENISLSELSEVEAEDQASLKSLKMIDSDEAETPTEKVADTLGNEISPDVILSGSSYGTEMPFATYYVNKKYSKMTANICTGDNTSTGDDVSFAFKVFADNNFDKPIKEISMRRSMEIQNIDLNISDYDYITIAITKEDSSIGAEAIVFGSYLYASETEDNLSLSKLPDNSNVESTKITSMKMVNYSDASDETTVDDISGTTQTHSMLLDLSSYSNDEAYATYYTHKDYKSFTADLYNYTDTNGSFDFVIYADLDPGKELFSSKRSANSGKESITADISDCTFVTIIITKHENDEHTGAILSDAYFNAE